MWRELKLTRKKKEPRDLEGIMAFLETVPFDYHIVNDVAFFTVVPGVQHIGFEISINLELDTFILQYGKFARACQVKAYDKAN